MATTNGTSVIGFQLLGDFSTTTAGWQLRFASVPPQNRLARLGTALHVRAIANNRFPVIQVFKLYGGGIAPVTPVIPSSSSTQLWVNWFRAGVVWAFERPD